MLRRALLTALAVVVCSGTAVPSEESTRAQLTAYLGGVQLPDGAFADSNASNETHITPYRGAYAAIGLSLNGEAATALRFARWYVAHMNRDDQWGPGCTIYDYTFSRHPFGIASTKSAGAMDAPAGVFLTAMRYLYATGDARAQAWVVGEEVDAECIARAAYGLYQPAYGCTQAVVGYDFCLTEDNFEVWRGLGDVAWLEENAWNNSSMRSAYLDEQSKIGDGLSQMWDAKNQNYNWARSTVNGAFTRSAWTQFYPGAVTQLWPVIVGYARSDEPRSVELWQRFKAAWPSMALASPVRSPWPWTAAAAAKMGDLPFVAEYESCLNAEYAARGYPYSWEVHDAGNMLTALVWASERSLRNWPREKRRAFRFCAFRY
ncbi:MAG TPA: hypothetical protein VKR56_01145 [Candidatus Cybelea sp.]|nr:hypothetical protein [Candidatus Cybelea sp.]